MMRPGLCCGIGQLADWLGDSERLRAVRIWCGHALGSTVEAGPGK
jgi:hypothetical protein